MKIYGKDFYTVAGKEIRPVYILSTDEPFWAEDGCKFIFEHAAGEGFNDATPVSFSEDGFNKDSFSEACTSPGLFAAHTEVKLVLKGFKSNVAKQALTILNESLNPALLAIVCLPRLSGQDLKSSKVISALEKKGLLTIFYPLEGNNLFSFIRQRASMNNLQLDQSSISLLAEAYEGSMSALVQVLEKLSLSGYSGKVPTNVVTNSISADNHFSSFSLTEAFISSNVSPEKRIRIIHNLSEQNTPAYEMTARIGNALSDLLSIRLLLDANKSPDSFFDNHRLLKMLKFKQPMYLQGAKSLSTAALKRLVRLICLADIKARSFDEEGAVLILEEIAVERSYPNKMELTSDAF